MFSLVSLSGIEWAVADHQARAESGSNRSVCNLSFGGAFSQSMNDAVNNAVLSGLLFVSAAGNDADTGDGDACSYSPASAEYGITVHIYIIIYIIIISFIH